VAHLHTHLTTHTAIGATRTFARAHTPQVCDTPGGHVTRDYREGLGQLGDLRFRVIDTSGLEPAAAPGSLQARSALPCGA
jgi:hypothetical protein